MIIPMKRSNDESVNFRDKALNLIARRPHTRRELMQKLMARGAESEVALEIVTEFVKLGYVIETEIAEDAVRLAKQKQIGKSFIKQKLLARGLPEAVVEDEIDRQVDEESEFEAAISFAHKKMRIMEGLAPHIKERRLGGALSRRGFNSSLIRKVLEELDLRH